MKKIFMGLLCLLCACGGKNEKDESGPIACPLIARMPLPEVTAKGYRNRVQYKTFINHKLLWDECRRESEFAVFEVLMEPQLISPGIPDPAAPVKMTFRSYHIDGLANSASVRFTVRELDAQCNDATDVFDQQIPVEVETYQSSQVCQDQVSNYRLNVNF